MAPKVRSWQGRAVIGEVHDGDTFKCTADLGFRVSVDFAVRLEGVGAPELTEPRGIEAKAALMQLLPQGSICTLETRRLDKYGRAQSVVTNANGVDVGAEMLRLGFARIADDGGYR